MYKGRFRVQPETVFFGSGWDRSPQPFQIEIEDRAQDDDCTDTGQQAGYFAQGQEDPERVGNRFDQSQQVGRKRPGQADADAKEEIG